jgi:hypothetical protein
MMSSCSRSGALHPDLDRELVRLASLDERELPSVLQNLDRDDGIGAWYRDPGTRKATLGFFASLTHSEAVARTILDNAERCAVPPSLAFAVAYEESRFNVDAFNRNGDSVDRGLFQLNSKSFPELEVSRFYEASTNARYGMSHLQYCLRVGGNEVAALAMYNAGHNRVTSGGTPRRTLDYIYRILKYEENIASLFAARVIMGDRARLALAVPRAGAAD